MVMVSNLPLSSDGIDHQVFAGSPDPRQHPFGPGQQPLSGQLCGHRWRRTSLWCPVSCRLSAAGVRFSGRPAPAGEFRLPHGRPTQRTTTLSLGLHRGCHVPHETDATGLGALCAPGTVMRSRPARSPQAAPAASQRPTPVSRSNIPPAEVLMTRRQRRFTRFTRSVFPSL